MTWPIARPLPSFTCAVQLRKGREDLPALFIFPGLGGTVDALTELSRSMDTPVKVYAFQSLGIDGETRPNPKIEDMAEHYLVEVVRLQPEGPYFLCGHSLGGLVAFEIATRLRAAGAEIGALILLDSPIDQAFWPWSYFLFVLWLRLRHHLSVIISLSPGKAAAYVVRRSRMLVNVVLARLRLAKPMIAAERKLPPALQAVWDQEVVAGSNYCPGFYPGKMIFLAADTPGWAPLDPDVFWRARVEELEVHLVPGGHRTMLDQPHVAGVALTLNDCLRPLLRPVSN
ncbi:alpha/beta fold hydrolase [Methylocapsa acidiphila]|uniref:thioesterase domain-containing protein n=1 Tax=Methylocapsa acidiphila TaxID=133552 RepID=UPI000A0125C9|nr:alpha/beta fold hydrolase [Methylocapsa acidiphila]